MTPKVLLWLRLWGTLATLALTWVGSVPAQAAPEGRVTVAVHTPVVPAWLNPSEFSGGLSPFTVYYGLHDALVKPMPEGAFTPCLAESWTKSKDGLTYEFKLRKGLTFHNGDPLTSEDVKFSFDRYKGAQSALLKSRVASFETPDPLTVRIQLKEPWPDFMLYYGGLTTPAGWVLPKAYITKVGDDGFKQNPVGAGPYKFVSMKPAAELVLEAFDQYWRKVPNVKTFVLRSVVEPLGRAAMLKTGEADIAFAFVGADAQELGRTPGIKLVPLDLPNMVWLSFATQWDPQSPWSKRQVREAVNYAIDRKGLAEADYLNFAKSVGSIVPSSYQFYKAVPPYPRDLKKAKQLLAEAGYPDGVDGGDIFLDANYNNVGQVVQTDLQAIGIKVRLRVMERAAFYAQWAEKKLPGIVVGIASTYDNAGSFLEQYVTSKGGRSFGTYPGFDDMIKAQASETDDAKRGDILNKLQDQIYKDSMFAPVLHINPIYAHGPRIEVSGLSMIKDFPYIAPFDDVKLKKN